MADLIKTRKQYIETLDFLKINRFAYDEANEIDDLIEALRKVAAAAVYYKQEKQKFLLGQSGYDKDGGKPLDEALDALPDWIIKDG